MVDYIIGHISSMEASLPSLNKWLTSNDLKVNASKSQLIIFGSRQNLQSMLAVSYRFETRGWSHVRRQGISA